MTINWKENANFLIFLDFTEAATSICLLKKVLATRRQKAPEFFQWLWLLIIINLIIEQLFAEYRFYYMTDSNVKILFWIRFMFCYMATIKFARCRRDFPSCFLHGLQNEEFCWNYETTAREIGSIIFLFCDFPKMFLLLLWSHA